MVKWNTVVLPVPIKAFVNYKSSNVSTVSNVPSNNLSSFSTSASSMLDYYVTIKDP